VARVQLSPEKERNDKRFKKEKGENLYNILSGWKRKKQTKNLFS